MPSDQSLPPVRRVVTGHAANGASTIDSDKLLQPVAFNTTHALAGATPVSFTLLWRTPSHPAPVQGPWEELHGQPNIPLSTSSGTTLRVVDIPARHRGVFHRTVSLDFGVVMEGEIVLVLDAGVETVMRRGDVAIQRATAHGWDNRSDENCRILFALLPSVKVRLEDGEELEAMGFETKPLEK